MGLGCLTQAPAVTSPPPQYRSQRPVSPPPPSDPSLAQSCRIRPGVSAVCGTWCARCPPPITTRCGRSFSICAGERGQLRGNGQAGLRGPNPSSPQLWDLSPTPSLLCRVIEHGERNRMSVQNVAIVFGPTLLRPETEEASMPMTMVFQNQVVELILQQCSDIFPPP